ncbi:hypothetical protein HMPREF0379_0377 [[Eubacterium] yurii subsp. margaretiae ATCC 43715]|nr:hypothetical protein HMPREF0379_0377 [[Eubacterium] yurii subsp. margaretiae ATCC 43715]
MNIYTIQINGIMLISTQKLYKFSIIYKILKTVSNYYALNMSMVVKYFCIKEKS